MFSPSPQIRRPSAPPPAISPDELDRSLRETRKRLDRLRTELRKLSGEAVQPARQR